MNEGAKQVTESKIIKRRPMVATMRQFHIENWKQSGLSMNKYCQQQGLALSSFSVWVQAHDKSEPAFKPIAVSNTLSKSEEQKNVIEIHLAHQIKIRFIDVSNPLFVASIAKELAKCS